MISSGQPRSRSLRTQPLDHRLHVGAVAEVGVPPDLACAGPRTRRCGRPRRAGSEEVVLERRQRHRSAVPGRGAEVGVDDQRPACGGLGGGAGAAGRRTSSRRARAAGGAAEQQRDRFCARADQDHGCVIPDESVRVEDVPRRWERLRSPAPNRHRGRLGCPRWNGPSARARDIPSFLQQSKTSRQSAGEVKSHRQSGRHGQPTRTIAADSPRTSTNCPRLYLLGRSLVHP